MPNVLHIVCSRKERESFYGNGQRGKNGMLFNIFGKIPKLYDYMSTGSFTSKSINHKSSQAKWHLCITHSRIKYIQTIAKYFLHRKTPNWNFHFISSLLYLSLPQKMWDVNTIWISSECAFHPVLDFLWTALPIQLLRKRKKACIQKLIITRKMRYIYNSKYKHAHFEILRSESAGS